MNIVMLDSGQLAGDVDFPEVKLPKFGWSQFVALPAEEVDERCWRADIIVSTHTPVNAQVIKESFKLKLIVAAGDNTNHIDKPAAKQRGIIICNVPGLTGDNTTDAQTICEQVVTNINAWLDQQPVNVVK